MFTTTGPAMILDPWLTTLKFRSINAVYLYILNVRHQQERERLGKDRRIVDRSMQVVRTINEDKETALPVGEMQDNSLDDVTDLKNEDFMYVYWVCT